jgi:hypothetical protein
MAVPQIKVNPLTQQLVSGLIRGVLNNLQNRHRATEAQKQREWQDVMTEQDRWHEQDRQRSEQAFEAGQESRGYRMARGRERRERMRELADKGGEFMERVGEPGAAAKIRGQAGEGRYRGPLSKTGSELTQAATRVAPTFGMPGMGAGVGAAAGAASAGEFKKEFRAPMGPEAQAGQIAERMAMVDPEKVEDVRERETYTPEPSAIKREATRRNILLRHALKLKRMYAREQSLREREQYKMAERVRQDAADLAAKAGLGPGWEDQLRAKPAEQVVEEFLQRAMPEPPPPVGGRARGAQRRQRPQAKPQAKRKSPEWQADYQKALSEGATEEEARQYADSVNSR